MAVNVSPRHRLTLTTEADVRAMYRDLKGETFVGTYVGNWESTRSRMSLVRQIISPSQLGQQLHTKLSHIAERLKDQVWKGFIPDGSSWKFYATLDVEHEIGDSGLCTIERFDVFRISEQLREYASRLGVSITITMVRDMLLATTHRHTSYRSLICQNYVGRSFADQVHYLIPSKMFRRKSQANHQGVSF